MDSMITVLSSVLNAHGNVKPVNPPKNVKNVLQEESEKTVLAQMDNGITVKNVYHVVLNVPPVANPLATVTPVTPKESKNHLLPHLVHVQKELMKRTKNV
jgi:hypothetical protein